MTLVFSMIKLGRTFFGSFSFSIVFFSITSFLLIIGRCFFDYFFRKLSILVFLNSYSFSSMDFFLCLSSTFSFSIDQLFIPFFGFSPCKIKLSIAFSLSIRQSWYKSSYFLLDIFFSLLYCFGFLNPTYVNYYFPMLCSKNGFFYSSMCSSSTIKSV